MAKDGTLIRGSVNLQPGAAPTNPVEGDLYYDDTANLLKIYTGSSFADISLSGGISSQTITATGSFVVPAGITTLHILACGGGGGGGAGGDSGTVFTGDTSAGGSGGAGGAGAVPYFHVVTVTPAESLNITIGDGGTGIVNPSNANFPSTTANNKGDDTVVSGTFGALSFLGAPPGNNGRNADVLNTNAAGGRGLYAGLVTAYPTSFATQPVTIDGMSYPQGGGSGGQGRNSGGGTSGGFGASYPWVGSSAGSGAGNVNGNSGGGGAGGRSIGTSNGGGGNGAASGNTGGDGTNGAANSGCGGGGGGGAGATGGSRADGGDGGNGGSGVVIFYWFV